MHAGKKDIYTFELQSGDNVRHFAAHVCVSLCVSLSLYGCVSAALRLWRDAIEMFAQTNVSLSLCRCVSVSI